MSLPNEVVVSTSKLTTLGDAVRERFGVSGTKTLDELTEIVTSHLPSGFQQVDYVASGGDQYINTGALGINGVKMKIEYNGNPSNSNCFFGAMTDNKHNRYDIIYYNGLFFCCGTSNNDDDILCDISSYTSSAMTIEQGVANQDLIVNGNAVKTFNSFTNTCSYPILLFARNDGYSVMKGKVKYYYCELYKDGVIQCKFIPCYRKSDNVIGMYDIINGQFYTNAGSGSFTCYPAPN